MCVEGTSTLAPSGSIVRVHLSKGSFLPVLLIVADQNFGQKLEGVVKMSGRSDVSLCNEAQALSSAG